ncbi:sodium:calcium antiporter [Candidatus Woesearchaeota archaeon]|nr:sodium:calcium antiporter [Candidatus Woesearchaeota archaeon]MBW3005793.1 sodium:calcium antiporter [Candidatus Woesearchaeota archaeon]
MVLAGIMELGQQFGHNYPIVFYSIACVLSLIIVLKSSDLAIYGISNYAKKLGISHYLIGFLVVAVGTSLPELVASITGALAGETSMVFGTVVGSNISDLTLVLGIMVIVGRTIKMEHPIVGKTFFQTLALAALPVILVSDGALTRPDGIILLAGFGAYIASLWLKEGKMGKMKKDVKLKTLWRDGFVFAGCIVALLLGARWLIYSASQIAAMAGISPYVVGLTIIALGTSLPEVMVEVKSILKGISSLAFGDLLGSIIANSTLVLGIIAIIHPIEIAFNSILFACIIMMGTVLLGLYFMTKKQITWKHGIVLVSIYAIFFVLQFFLM